MVTVLVSFIGLAFPGFTSRRKNLLHDWQSFPAALELQAVQILDFCTVFLERHLSSPSLMPRTLCLKL